MDTNSELLNKRIEESLKALPDLEATDREKRVRELESLYKLRIEETKTETEARQKGAEHMDAMCQAQAEAKERKINFLPKNFVEGVDKSRRGEYNKRNITKMAVKRRVSFRMSLTREPGRWKRAGNREPKMVSELRGRRARALARDGCAR